MPPKKGKKAKKKEGGEVDDITALKKQIVDEIHNAEDIKELTIK